MTFKDLSRFVQIHTPPENKKMEELVASCQDIPFFKWAPTHANLKQLRIINNHRKDRSQYCCFNHIIGLPVKNGTPFPLFDYEKEIFKALVNSWHFNSDMSNRNSFSLTYIDSPIERKKATEDLNQRVYASFKNKHLWIKKATGLGVTEFMLRFMAWLCLRNDDYKGSQMVIVTGPNQDIAIKLIKRMKALFHNLGITFDSKETMIELNGCTIEAYPSNHIDAFRSLTNPKFILIDEGDFFRKSEQEDFRHVAERYIGKSDPYIVMISTPNAPDGLFEKIEKEPFETCIYKKMFMDYTYGLDRIYTKEEIDKAKRSPSFEREYCLKYQGLIGNVFSTQSIARCQSFEYNPNIIVKEAKKSMGIDPSFGSSQFGIVVTQYVNGKIQVIIAEEHDRPDFNDMINRVWEIKRQCGIITNIYVDAANPEIWQALKREFKERYDEQYLNDKLN